MLKFIDSFLNKITMYRLVLYYVLFLLLVAVVLGSFGLLPEKPLALVVSYVWITLIAWIANTLSARVLKVPTNSESVYITAGILALIVEPPASSLDFHFFAVAALITSIAMISKYVLALRHKHFFNPAAVAVAITAVTITEPAVWWIGTLYMAPFVLLGGVLVARKLRYADLVGSFMLVATAGTVAFSMLARDTNFLVAVRQAVLYSPLFFFGFTMLTEPLTAPPTRAARLAYGAFTGFLFAPFAHIGTFAFAPETALLAGNILSYSLSFKEKMLLVLEEKRQIAADTYEFAFTHKRPVTFKPGQYLEWTLRQDKVDARGNRRYFTVASSPTESLVRIGIKLYENASSFKRQLMSMEVGDAIGAGQLAGDFILPKNPDRKLVFIAGGIGVTPFRSMIKYLSDRDERRTITLLYSNRTMSDIAYAEVFDEAAGTVGAKIVYTLTDAVPGDWPGERGFIDEAMIKRQVPDYAERTFYVSGPQAMVTATEALLRKMGIPGSRIKKDFFPGFA
jgi:ferredoxin-NADP reductase